MKVRQGFVSNSSTSSFILVGIVKDKSEYTEPTDEEKIKILEAAGFDWKFGDDEVPEEDVADCVHDAWYEYQGDNEDAFKILRNGEDGAPKDKVVYGKELASWSDDSCYSPREFMTIKKIQEIGEEVKKEFNIDGEPVLIVGTRLC
jgi:hypothetical protein